MDKQINHDKYDDESKTRTGTLSKLPDDGDPWAPNNLLTRAPNNLLTPGRKKNTSSTSVGHATNKICFDCDACYRDIRTCNMQVGSA